jgi:hypothetical protein
MRIRAIPFGGWHRVTYSRDLHYITQSRAGRSTRDDLSPDAIARSSCTGGEPLRAPSTAHTAAAPLVENWESSYTVPDCPR